MQIAAAPAVKPTERRRRGAAAAGMGGAQLCVGDAVWLRNRSKDAVFVRGVLSSAAADGCGVELSDGSLVQRHADELYAANGPDEPPPPDHSSLVHLNEPCILENTRARYAKGEIYTYTGQILVALNPFRPLAIYGAEAMAGFANRAAVPPPPPHVYAVAERAYVHMLRAGASQAVVMSGESGAGKTETAKHIALYLACLLYTSPSPRDGLLSRMPSSA